MGHANVPDTTWGYDDARGCYHITAVRDIPKDKFLTITYGKKANSRFLVNYGFCLPINSRNKGFLPFEIGADEPESVEVEISTNSVQESIKRCQKIGKMHCSQLKITDGMAKQRWAWDYLAKKCEGVLGEFATTLQFDYQQLKQEDISPNVR